MKKATWTEKYEILLQEDLSIDNIMTVRSCGQTKAQEIRNQAVRYCKMNHIEIGQKRVPTNIVLKIMHKELDYYYENMKREIEFKQLTAVC